jgi:hypothetical protein
MRTKTASATKKGLILDKVATPVMQRLRQHNKTTTHI